MVLAASVHDALTAVAGLLRGESGMGIHIDWRVALHPDDREAVRHTITASFIHWAEAGERPAGAIVSRPSFDPYDDRIDIAICCESGRVLGGGRVSLPKKPESTHDDPTRSGLVAALDRISVLDAEKRARR